MGFIIEDNVSIVDETCNVLHFIANEEEKIKDMMESFNKFGMESDKFIKKDLKNLFKFIDRFKAKNKIPLEKLRRYFKANGEGGAECVAKLFVLNITEEELVDSREKILSMEDERLKESVMKDILGSLDYFPPGLSLENEMENLDVSKEFMPFLINKCTLDGEIKWYLTVIAQEPKIYLIELIDIIIESIENFKDTFKVMEKDVEAIVKTLKYEIEKDFKYITEVTGVKDLDKWDRDIHVYPSMVNFNGVSIRCSRSFLFDTPRRDELYFGWKIKELIEVSHGKDKEDEILNGRLKCLSDKSKFSILKMLKEKPMFGQEIATALSLTTATVSYHMNALMCSKLVSIERIENKIFYTINGDSIEEIIEKLSEEFK